MARINLLEDVPEMLQRDIDDDTITQTEQYSNAKATIALRHLQELERAEEGIDNDSDGDDGNVSTIYIPADHKDATESDDEDDFVQELEHLVIYTDDELLLEGLRIIGYTDKQINRVKKKERNEERFRSHYGSNTNVCICIWEDLQTTEMKKAFVPPSKRNIKFFLMALHFLKRYPTEIEREVIFSISPQYGREWVWYYVERIRALKEIKIKFPDDKEIENDIWIMTVDGTHCWIHEPMHPDWSQDKKYFSHKHGHAGINYELGVYLPMSRLIWMNGPFPAGPNDISIFTQKGLKEKLKLLNKKAIGDMGYAGHPNECSIFNPHDEKEVDRFKSRALKRHERFNGYTKAFDCLSGRFRHSVKRFADCFEAVCVICQYQIENGYDLYDILIEDLLYDIV